jgi:hypothetical protein
MASSAASLPSKLMSTGFTFSICFSQMGMAESKMPTFDTP